MPEKKLSISIARQWEMLKILPTRGAGMTANAIFEALNQAGFKVSLKQVQRDLQGLKDIFPIEYIKHENENAWYWLWSEGKSANFPGLTVSEAVSLSLVEKTVKPLLPGSMLKALQPRFQQAAEKLKAIELQNREAQLARKVRAVPQTLQRLAPAIDAKVLDEVQSALVANEQIDARYRSMGATTDAPMRLKLRRLHPLGLIQRGPVTYLVATEDAHTDARLYALHRMISAVRTYENASRPSGFDLDDYIKSNAPLFGGGKSIVLKARVSEDLARILDETPLSAKQELIPPKSKSVRTLLEAEVLDSWQLRWWVLSQGAKIEVIAPISLRKEVAETLSHAAKQYKLFANQDCAS
jgi:predicted DNA-binding transcriptional regulator YafY